MGAGVGIAAGLGLALALAGCGREARDLRPDPRSAAAVRPVPLAANRAGPESSLAIERPGEVLVGRYDENAWAISEGKRLYQAYNCSGCHARGGGGIGPPLMQSATRRFPDSPEDIYRTILQGRTSGMPSFAGRIPAYEIWQIVAYVRSLSGLVPRNAAPGRDDHMEGR